MIRKKFRQVAEEGLPDGEVIKFPKSTPTPRKRRADEAAAADSPVKPKRVAAKKTAKKAAPKAAANSEPEQSPEEQETV